MGKAIRWTLLFVVLVIFSSGAVAFYTVFFRPADRIVVPPLRERSVTEAVDEAERLGFAVKIEQTVSSLPAGRVLAQSPEPGARANKNQLIILQVSQGGEQRAIPDLRGQEVSRAQRLLQEQGFAVGDVIRIKDGAQPGGVVIAQSPAAPANIPVDHRVDLLVSEGGAGRDGRLTVPDVARRSEREAREILTASGLRVQAVDKVYSPSMSEGMAIETRPPAGTLARSGDGVRLKIATLQKPAGYVEPASVPSTGTGTEVENASGGQGGVVVKVPGQGDIFLGEGASAGAQTPITEANPNLTVFDQEGGRRVIRNPSLTPETQPEAGGAPQSPQAGRPQPAGPAAPAPLTPGGKVAKVRYQVPPLAQPLDLRIEMVDPSGKKVVLDRKARSGEFVSLEVPYEKECVVTFYLGGEFVWQDKYQ